MTINVKQVWLLIVAILITITSACQNSEEKVSGADLPNPIAEYPPYDSVLQHFFSTYELPEKTSDGELIYTAPSGLAFARKPKGWYVIEKYYDKEANELKNGERHQLWSADKKEYKPLEYTEASSTDEELINKYRKQWNTRLYKFNAYYGYAGWQDDIIETYGNADKLSDTLKYGLARAYSNSLQGESHKHDDKPLRKSKGGTKSVDDEYLAIMNEWGEQTIAQFKELSEQAPEFETIVGRSPIKYANEVMFVYNTFLTYHSEREAKKWLRPNLYSPFWTDYATNLLESCEKNAILFTNGDNDTYPLWYVQQQLGIRADVRVINVSLLGAGQYINMYKRPVAGHQGINTPYDPEFYEADVNNVVLLQESYKESDLKLALQQLFSDEAEQDDNYTKLPAKVLTISNSDFPSPTQFGDDYNPASWPETMSFNFSRSYLLKNQLFVAAIIANHFADDPIYFSTTLNPGTYVFYKEYLKQEGMAYRLSPETPNTSYPTDIPYAPKRTYELLTKQYSWPEKEYLDHSKMVNRICYSYIHAIFRAVDYSFSLGDTAQAGEMLSIITQALPAKEIDLSLNMIVLADTYYQLGKDAEGDNLLLYFANKVSERKKNHPGTDESGNPNPKWHDHMLDKLLGIAELNDRQVIVNKIKRMR